MSAAAVEAPVARSYTKARRHPWVMGKLGEIRLWLGPYSRPQLVIAGVGLLVLGKTLSWWWPVAGPLPLVGLGVAVWAVRCARIGGRVPEAALWGCFLVLVQPRAGRIGGRPARPRPSARLGGGFHLTESVTPAAATTPSRATERTGTVPADRPARRPVSSSAPRPAKHRPRRSRRDHAAGPVAGPSRGAPVGEAAAARPRSSLDLLLEQAGARTTDRV